MDDNKLVIIDPDGVERVCEILFTHEKNDVKYVVFEFLDTNEISAAIYTPEENSDEGFLSDIETDEEWEMIDGLLESYYEESEEFEPFDEDELED